MTPLVTPIMTPITMKRFALILLCLTLTIAVACAKDFHLTEVLMLEDDRAGHPVYSTVYIFVWPDNERRQEVFRTFDSKAMESLLASLPHGSSVHYDPNTWDHKPSNPPAKIEALKALCRKNDITFIEKPNWGD
jgi:hypothetical protein